MQCKSLRESGAELKKFNIAYFGASCDPANKNKQFAEKLELDYPLLSDTDTKVAAAYGILRGKRSRRNTVFVDIEGNVAHVESKVDLRNHGTQIANKLKELKFPLKGDSGNDNREAKIKAFKAKLIESITKTEDVDLAPLFDAADADGNGTVDQSEMDALIKQMLKATEGKSTSKGAAAGTESNTSPDLTDIKCMFMDDQNVSEKFFVAFKGQKVYFCCWKCPTKFSLSNPKHVAAADEQIALIRSRQ